MLSMLAVDQKDFGALVKGLSDDEKRIALAHSRDTIFGALGFIIHLISNVFNPLRDLFEFRRDMNTQAAVIAARHHSDEKMFEMAFQAARLLDKVQHRPVKYDTTTIDREVFSGSECSALANAVLDFVADNGTINRNDVKVDLCPLVENAVTKRDTETRVYTELKESCHPLAQGGCLGLLKIVYDYRQDLRTGCCRKGNFVTIVVRKWIIFFRSTEELRSFAEAVLRGPGKPCS